MKPWMRITLWVIFGLGCFTLLSLAYNAQGEKVLKSPEIAIHVNGEHPLLTEDELLTRLKRNGYLFNGQSQEELKLHQIETFIKQMSEVRHVDVFAQVGDRWSIDIETRQPIARIYNKYGESFYLDSDGEIMSASPQHCARVVVITGEISDRKNSVSVTEIINNNSLKTIRKLDNLYRISNYVCNDPFLQSLIGQIHVQKSGDLVLIPMVGEQVIVFGTASTDKEVKEKFDKLKVFYKEGIPYEGWDTYELINLKFTHQVVCRNTKKDGKSTDDRTIQ
jgi:cell division protein FtsQ